MAKHVFIIRHAKSDWSLGVSDYDRPLNERGFRDAPFMAERLAANPTKPQLLVSSPAKRALTTAQIFAERLSALSKDIQIEPSIYEASTKTLLELINNMDDQWERIAIFGHNPGLSELASYLSEEDYLNMPTCAIVHLHFPHANHWSEISGGTGAIIDFWYPKDGVQHAMND